MPTYAVGDIQGCAAEFEQLLDKLAFTPGQDTLWVAGDIVNRGPASLASLRRVMALGDSAISVLGNHDLHMLSVMCGHRAPSAKDTLDDILQAPDRDELKDWVRQQPLLHHDNDLGYTMVHAGLHPAWNLHLAQSLADEVEHVLRGPDYEEFLHSMYSDKPSNWSDDLQGIQRLRFTVNCFTRMRYCKKSGKLDFDYKGPIDKAPKQLLPWHEVPARESRDLRILFGHWSSHGESRNPNIIPLDFGCIWGGTLRAYCLETGSITEIESLAGNRSF